ncbi:MAG: RsmB/NOP family class I SAM-dependent RNA methyltransferase [Pseudomonadota bacterium]
MTPAARVAAAIDILDRILGGAPAEQALTTWARGSRFAGSKDRAAIRDLVFDSLRRKRSRAHLGGAMTGRGLMIGALREDQRDPDDVFSGIGYAPSPLSEQVRQLPGAPPTEAVRLDCPEWLEGQLRDSLGADFAPVLEALRQRAPVYLRVNTLKADVATAQAALAEAGIVTQRNDLASTALEVTSGARAVSASQAYKDGLVELQDAASQAVVEALGPLGQSDRILDYCAGGGGKTLALAALSGAPVAAHDAHARRMGDLPGRAKRAGARISLVDQPESLWDLVLIDVPCSGSGAWRRQPDAKWRLTEADLQGLRQTQAAIMDRVAALVAPTGRLAYATCSILDAENGAQVGAFLERHPDWLATKSLRLLPTQGGDGFFVTILTR